MTARPGGPVGHSAIDTDEFAYDLPDDRIAQVPAEPRDAARLLVDGGPGRPVRHRHVRDLADECQPGDLVVVNDTRVRPARLALRRPGGGPSRRWCSNRPGDGTWEALLRPSRRIRAGDQLSTVDGTPAAVVVGPLGEGRWRLRWCSGATPDALLDRHGEVPLPPYLHRPLDDPERYQTSSPAVPPRSPPPRPACTSPRRLLDRLADAGAALARLELVVGLGTFRPITAARVDDHVMHAETYRIPPETQAAVRRRPPGAGRGHHRGPGARELAGHRPGRGPHRAVHPSGPPLRRRRPAADQLPRPPVVAAGAGRRVRRAPLAGPVPGGPGRRTTASCPSATPCWSTGPARDVRDGPGRRRRAARRSAALRARGHRRGGPGRHRAHRAGQLRHPDLHAGGHPGCGADPRRRRPRGHRRPGRAGQHLPPDAASRCRRGARPGRTSPLQRLGRSSAHRLGRLPDLLAGAHGRRGRGHVRLDLRRQPPPAHARVGGGRPGAAGRRHPDGPRRLPGAARAPTGHRRRRPADAALGRAGPGRVRGRGRRRHRAPPSGAVRHRAGRRGVRPAGIRRPGPRRHRLRRLRHRRALGGRAPPRDGPGGGGQPPPPSPPIGPGT